MDRRQIVPRKVLLTSKIKHSNCVIVALVLKDMEIIFIESRRQITFSVTAFHSTNADVMAIKAQKQLRKKGNLSLFCKSRDSLE